MPLLALVALLSYDQISAWSEPLSPAPQDNVEAPINTGSLPQEKTGSIEASTLITPEVHAGMYCNSDGSDCVDASAVIDVANNGVSGAADGIGYNQTWVPVSRSQWVWYRNETSRPIMVFHKNYESGSWFRVGETPSTYTDLDFRDFDSDHDNGATIIVPPGHYYQLRTPTDVHGNVRELR